MRMQVRDPFMLPGKRTLIGILLHDVGFDFSLPLNRSSPPHSTVRQEHSSWIGCCTT